MNNETPKLSISLVPQNAWGRNVRAVVSSLEWSRLRWEFGASLEQPTDGGGFYCGRSSLGQPFLVCEACGGQFDNLHLHELWDFNDTTHIQKLIGCQALCEECHNTVHFGRSCLVGLTDQVSSHLKTINGWSDQQTKHHIKLAFQEWSKRDQFHYQLDLSFLYENKLATKRQVHLDWLDRPRRVRDRLDALSWSQTLMGLPNAVILDTETTGLIEGAGKNPNAEAIELAIISVKGKVLYNGRFKPRYPIPSHVIDIHGITNQAIQKAPAFSKEYAKILRILSGKIVVAYNSRFDQKIIENTCRLFELPPPDDVVWECAMWAYKGYMESPQFLRLPNGKHSALADCVATLDLIHTMANDHRT